MQKMDPTYPQNEKTVGCISTYEDEQDETKLNKPIRGLKLLHGHEWLINHFVSVSLLSLSLSFWVLCFSFISIYIFSLLSLPPPSSSSSSILKFSTLNKNDTNLKKSKMTERIALKGALSLVQIKHILKYIVVFCHLHISLSLPLSLWNLTWSKII